MYVGGARGFDNRSPHPSKRSRSGEGFGGAGFWWKPPASAVSTDLTGRYDERQDLVRVAMESGEVPMPEPQFSASFAHVAPNQCSLRLEMANKGSWVTFERK